MTVVTMEHLRSIPGYGPKPGFCTRGARAFFIRYGLNWQQFRHEGLPAEDFLQTGDALALALVAWAKQSTEASQ